MKTRGDGRIFQRKGTSLWWCAYYLRGREYRESTSETDEQKARKFLKRRLKEVGADQIGAKRFVGPQQERITVSEQLDALEADYKLRGKWSDRVASSMKPIRDYFGQFRAVQITTEAVDQFINQLLRGDPENGKPPKAPATVNRSTQLLAQAFKLAIERLHLSNAPVIRHLSEAGNARQGFFNEAEFRAVVQHLPDYLKDFVLFGYLTGWRKGEIASLRWEDVDGDVIRLRPEHSKSREGRTVPLVGELAELLARRKSARQVSSDSGMMIAAHVFHRQGKPIGSIRKAWATACSFANVPGRLFHDLRRCAVRNMVRAGVPTDVARSISGHKTAAIFSRYNIVAEDQKRDALERTQDYLRLAAEQPRQRVAVLAQQSARTQ